MEALLYFLFWGALLFFMMRMGCGAHMAGGHGHGRSARAGDGPREDVRWVAPDRATDSVCGKTVRTATAKPSVLDGDIYYFCSRDCREVFEAAPDLYLGGPSGDEAASRPKRIEHHHA